MKYFFLVVAVIYGAAIYGGFAPMPFKATDPSDPRFNINRFRFEDYPSEDSLSAAVEKMFPAGTSLVEIDRVLVKNGGAKKSPPFKLDVYRQEHYDKPELYVSYNYFKESLVNRLYQLVIPVPGRTDRLVSVEVDMQNKSTFIGVYR